MRGGLSHKKQVPSRREEFFLPWFLTTGLRKRVDKLLPRYYHFRLRMYFRQYGCISCHRRDHLQYGSNGLCRNCFAVVGDRLRRTDVKLQRQFGHEQEHAAEEILRRLESAGKLLADLKGLV